MEGLHVSEIGQIALTVLDLEQAKDFYRNTLGMRFLFSAGTMPFFQCGPVRLLVGTSEPGVSDRAAILYFRVEDIQGAYRALEGKGALVLQEPHLVAKMPDHDLWICFFKDPAGNPMALMSEVKRAQMDRNIPH